MTFVLAERMRTRNRADADVQCRSIRVASRPKIEKAVGLESRRRSTSLYLLTSVPDPAGAPSNSSGRRAGIGCEQVESDQRGVEATYARTYLAPG
jgi:hypothetical protein